MITQSLDWSVGYTTDPCIAPKEFYNAAVPGSVQSDYAKAMHLPPYQYETNFSEYDWMEDMYWIYKTTLFFHLFYNTFWISFDIVSVDRMFIVL